MNALPARFAREHRHTDALPALRARQRDQHGSRGAEPADGFAPLSDVLREIGVTLIELLGVATAGYILLVAFGIF
jgi:hypothetical protein